METVREWAKKRPELCVELGGCRFARDEGWAYPPERARPEDTAPPAPEVPAHLKFRAVRQK